ncbi:hypothetical protein WOLCODRAFT_162777 [Wolfiporia cocos MD-104 SS10]|uniref:Uncharacterized protein n=1 Tax=Wolfiporia cocos (strain MD-104) TaxID=742152 RepID=A0A2H3JQH3_WOLCO|nr:hypothetical protein WOLCODRAFT_162777 [Wolfiporia cocos MD-104 SS10]
MVIAVVFAAAEERDVYHDHPAARTWTNADTLGTVIERDRALVAISHRANCKEENMSATWSSWALTVLDLVAGLPPEIARAYHDVLTEGLNGPLRKVDKRRDAVDAGGGVEIVKPRPWYPTEDFTRILRGSWDIRRVDGLSHETVIVVPGNEGNGPSKVLVRGRRGREVRAQLVVLVQSNFEFLCGDEGLEWRDAELINCRVAGDRDPEQLYEDVDMYSLGTDEPVDQEIEVYGNDYDDGGVVQRAEPAASELQVIDIKLEWILARPTVPLSADELARFPAGYRDFAWPTWDVSILSQHQQMEIEGRIVAIEDWSSITPSSSDIMIECRNASLPCIYDAEGGITAEERSKGDTFAVRGYYSV